MPDNEQRTAAPPAGTSTDGDTGELGTTLILRTLAALYPPAQIVELRVIGLPRVGTAAGWFDNPEALALNALTQERAGPEGIYVTLNPLHEACLARAANRVRLNQKTTSSDKDVIARNWLPIDIDPVRPAGVSSTAAEIEHARATAKRIAAYLEGDCGWPPGIRAFSGNGVHLLYKVVLPNTAEAKDAIAGCLTALDARFTSDFVKVDTANHNAARIWKLYGTIARKGDSTETRPHRRSMLWRTNGNWPTFAAIQPVPIDKLLALAGPNAPDVKRPTGGGRPKKSKPAAGRFYDLDKFIAENGIVVKRKEPWQGTGVRYILEQCVFDPSHVNTSACIGRSEEGRIFYKCQHDSCSGMTWADVKRKFVRDHPGAIATREALKAAGITDAEDPWAAAKAMIDEQYTDADTGECLLRRHRETFYRYDQKTHAYVPLSEDTVRVEVTRWLADRIERVTRSKIADTINALAAITTLPADIEPPFLSDVCAKDGYAKADPRRLRRIVLRNGILDMDAVLRGDAIEHAFGPHTARWFTASALPFDFPAAESQAECPRWCLFLDEIFEGDAERRALLQEAFGYCFYPGTNYEAFFVLHGTGRNGKSVCLAVLRSLLGEDNVSSLSPEQLVSQWGLYQIYGKLANICADMNETDRVAEGIIKAVVSGDLVTADRKYLNPIQFRPTCKLWFATNILPRFTDTTLGIWRRMILLPFNYTVPPEKIDPDLFATLREELPGIFLWTIRGLVRLCNNRRFSEATSCAEAVTAYRRNCFPILTFLEECTDRGPDLYVQAGDLWTAYKRWGEAVGLSHLKRLHEFLRDIALFVPESKAKKYTAFEARSVLCGIGLRADLDALGAATRAIPFQQNVFDSQEDTRP